MVKYIENYALYEIIGSGVYGKVYRAINNVDKKEYAIKVIPITKFRENKKLEECTVNEINILSNIEAHQHIIRYYDMLKTTNNFYFIYEYCNGGTLENLLSKEKKLSERDALQIFKQLMEAFQILNKYNIMHRDMKPDNIFFHNGTIKLGDFGFCKNLNSAEDMARTMLGSPIYMAPEVLKGEIYSNKADIWSLGVVLYEMVFGHCPFQSNSIANLIEVLNTQNLAFPGNISSELKRMISRMLTKDPAQRIGWMELFQVKINDSGYIEESRVPNKILSLNEAKASDEDSPHLSSSVTTYNSSSKNLGPSQSQPHNREQSYEDQTGPRNFKKNRNTCVVEPSPKEESNPEVKQLADDHRALIEAVKLAMEIVESKISNSLGYAYLLLDKASQQASELSLKTSRKDLGSLLEKESREIKMEKESISNKMFPYELKGLDDWKKYLRGKFFEEEKTIGIWYKMVCYLSGSRSQGGQSYKSMADSVKNILY